MFNWLDLRLSHCIMWCVGHDYLPLSPSAMVLVGRSFSIVLVCNVKTGRSLMDMVYYLVEVAGDLILRRREAHCWLETGSGLRPISHVTPHPTSAAPKYDLQTKDATMCACDDGVRLFHRNIPKIDEATFNVARAASSYRLGVSLARTLQDSYTQFTSKTSLELARRNPGCGL